MGRSIVRFRLLPLAALVLLGALAACYLPNGFRSEIRLGKDGSFALAFYGELIWAPLYRDIQSGKYTSDQIPAQVDLIQRDLARDQNFKKIESLGQGRFKVEYEREGRLQASQKSPSCAATRSSSCCAPRPTAG